MQIFKVIYKKIFIAFVVLFCFVCNYVLALDLISQEVKNIEKETNSKFGISAIHLESGIEFNYNEKSKFLMASTVKLPIAIYTLYLSEKNQINLKEIVEIKDSDMVPGSGKMWIYFYHSGLYLSLYNILESMITISDNASSDILLRKIGGPKKLHKFLSDLGLGDIDVQDSMLELFLKCYGITEVALRDQWSLDYWVSLFNKYSYKDKTKSMGHYIKKHENVTTPIAMVQLMVKLYKQEIINKENSDLLIRMMRDSITNKNRIKGLLTKSVKVASKTGTLDIGKYVSVSDVGIITLPNNLGNIVIAIYGFSDRAVDVKDMSYNIARVSKTIYDYFLVKIYS